jgi:Cu2+-exporting ATPase
MSEIAESSLRIGGMHCAACADVVERALLHTPGVVEARVSAAAQCATVRWDPGRTQAGALQDAVRAAGYEACPDTAAAARAARAREARTALWRLFVAGFCAMQVMMLAAPSYFAAPGEIAPEWKRLLDWAGWLLALPVLLFSAAPFFAGAWRSARARRIGMDVPVALGTAVAFVASTGAAFAPGGLFGHEVWFDSMTMFIAFLLAGRWLEMRARHRAEATLEGAAMQLPQVVVRLARDGTPERVDAALLRPGDRLRVALGEAFAADGRLVEGDTAADESLLTGESLPCPKRPGDAVIAGSLNVGAPVVMQAERVGADTRHEAIAALMRAVRTARPALAAVADRWAAPFLWTVLALAAAAGIAWSRIDPARTAWVVVSVLIVTCPCALSLAVPSALLAAARTMARQGLLLRHPDAIERLARLDVLFIDKTGTLTAGTPRCRGVRLADPHDGAADALARKASSLAAWATHPLARALHAAWPPDDTHWHDVRELPGRGLEARDETGRTWRLGAASWVGTEREAGTERAAVDDGGAQVALARGDRTLACFAFEEALREDAARAVAALRAEGVRVELLSGDDPARVRALAARLPLDAATGGLAPEDKLAAVRLAQRAGDCVAMVGDGVNDAPVLAQADVAIAMGEGALVARAQADGVLLSNRLEDLVRARRLARRALAIVRQNLAWAAAYNAVCVPLALAGLLPPWAAGLGMAASSLVVVCNSLRLAR